MRAVVSKIPEIILSHDDDDDDDDEDDDDGDGDEDGDEDDNDELPSFLVWVLLLERGRAGPDHSTVLQLQLDFFHYHHLYHRLYILRN